MSDPGIVDVRLSPEAPVRVGSTVTIALKALGQRQEITNVVVEHDPQTRTYAEAPVKNFMPVEVAGRWTVEPCRGGCRATTVVTVRAPGLMKPLERLVAAMIRRSQTSSFGTLKTVLEAQAGYGPPAES